MNRPSRRLAVIFGVLIAALTLAGTVSVAQGSAASVGNAQQVVVVSASGYGTSYATLSAYSRTASGWRRVFGPWSARIGRNGFACCRQKREGDGRTPSGSYDFQFMFGVYANPGVHFSYRRALSTSRWDDDSSSARYNEWVDTRYAWPGRNPEHMRVSPSYNYGAVIGYNLARTPGRGSAIFLHVSAGTSTAGCVALPQSELLTVLRWLTPGKGPRIVMGVHATV